MKKSILVTILLTVGLFSQSASELRAIDEKGFDIFGEMKDQSQMLKTGMARGGIVLSQEQLLKVVQARNYNAQRILNLLGGEIQIVETIVEVTVKAGVSQEAIDFFQELANNPTDYFYKSQRDKGLVAKFQEAIDLLTPSE